MQKPRSSLQKRLDEPSDLCVKFSVDLRLKEARCIVRVLSILMEMMSVLALSVLLPLAKLLVVISAVAETGGWVYLGLWSVNRYQAHHDAMVFLWPVLATVGIYFQLTLWYYFWLKVAHRSNRGRVLAEYFCSYLRYPVVRQPHPWE
jgi:hypothetical protein